MNRFLAHLWGRSFARATRRAYAYDVLNFLRFLVERGIALVNVRPTDLFDYLDWQVQPERAAGSTVVRLAGRRGAAPATLNRRIAAVRGLFEFAVIIGAVGTSPVPALRRTSGLRARRGLLGHVPARHPRRGGRLVREQRRLPESLGLNEVEAFRADLGTYRDRAMVLLMLLGGLAFSWVGPNRLIWEGWLDSRARAAIDDRARDLVMRIDVYVGERDSFGLGFSDNVSFHKQY